MGARVKDIYNYLQLSERIATAGQPNASQYRAIAEAGYQTVINLALTESTNALPDAAAIATELGLEYIHIPVLWESPTAANFQEFVEVMTARAERKIFVHCAANKRVSAFMYIYRQQSECLDPATAKVDLDRIWQPNEVWQQFIDRQLSQVDRG